LRFWDASAIVPLLMTETTTKALQRLAAEDPAMLVWWATEVECASAIARLEREGALDPPAVIEAFDRLKRLADGWHEVDSSDSIREAAVRFLRASDSSSRRAPARRRIRRRRTATIITRTGHARRPPCCRRSEGRLRFD